MENGANVNDKNDQGMSAVEEIIRNDHKDLLSCVFDGLRHKKRDVKVPGSFSYVHLAASVKESRCLKYFIEDEGLSPNEICNIHDQTNPLHFAVLADSYENTKYLLK